MVNQTYFKFYRIFFRLHIINNVGFSRQTAKTKEKYKEKTKMATFFNQASMIFGGTVTNSNVTSGEIVSALTITKTAVSADYGPGDGITYVVTIENGSNADAIGLTLTDDLGVYTLPGSTNELTPLTYVTGSLLYYQNGVPTTAPTAVGGPPLVISGITVPAGGNATLIYEARANSFAPLTENAVITNTATLDSCDATATAEIGTRNEARLTISKSTCPSEVVCSGEVTYTIVIQNTGNIAVLATDDLIITDTFNPILTDITVTLNGTELVEGTDYTYNEATGEFTTLAGAITVPAATFVRDSVTGVVTTTPGTATLVISGTI